MVRSKVQAGSNLHCPLSVTNVSFVQFYYFIVLFWLLITCKISNLNYVIQISDNNVNPVICVFISFSRFALNRNNCRWQQNEVIGVVYSEVY